MDKKIIKDLKKYSWVGNLAITTVVMLVMGVGLGLLVDYFADTKYWVIIISLIFLIMAIANFIYRLLKIGEK